MRYELIKSRIADGKIRDWEYPIFGITGIAFVSVSFTATILASCILVQPLWHDLKCWTAVTVEATSQQEGSFC
jgi:hypothetical protein